METIALKKTVLKYVKEEDARLLEMMLSLAESYENNDSSVLSESDYHEMDNRRLNHLKEKSESYSWEEVQQRAKNALKK